MYLRNEITAPKNSSATAIVFPAGALITATPSDVAVSSYEQGGANPDTKALGSLEEEVALTAAKVQVLEKTFDASGKAGPLVIASWQVPKAARR